MHKTGCRSKKNLELMRALQVVLSNWVPGRGEYDGGKQQASTMCAKNPENSDYVLPRGRKIRTLPSTSTRLLRSSGSAVNTPKRTSRCLPYFGPQYWTEISAGDGTILTRKRSPAEFAKHLTDSAAMRANTVMKKVHAVYANHLSDSAAMRADTVMQRAQEKDEQDRRDEEYGNNTESEAMESEEEEEEVKVLEDIAQRKRAEAVTDAEGKEAGLKEAAAIEEKNLENLQDLQKAQKLFANGLGPMVKRANMKLKLHRIGRMKKNNWNL